MFWLALEVRPFWSTSQLFFIPDKNRGEFDMGPKPAQCGQCNGGGRHVPGHRHQHVGFQQRPAVGDTGPTGELQARVIGVYSIGGGDLLLLATPTYDFSTGTCAR